MEQCQGGPSRRRQLRRRAALLAGALMACAVAAALVPGAEPASSATAITATFTPAADAYVQGDQPGVNFGTGTTLRADASPDTRAYLRFSVQGLQGTVTSVALRVWANSSHSTGYRVFPVADTSWGETTVTYANAPALGSTALGSSGALTAGTWSQADVAGLVTGNGTVAVALTTTSATAMSLASRESGATAPQLVVTTTASPDTTAPSRPANLRAATGGTGEIDLTWTASTDNVGVDHDVVSRDGSPAATVGGAATTFADTGLAPGSSHSYTVEAFDAAGNRSGPSAPVTGTAGTASTDKVIAAAGDIACDPLDPNYNAGVGTSTYCHEKKVSDLLVNQGLAAVLPLGDNAYYCGGLGSYLGSYAPTWGRLDAIVRPVPGNHEYLTTGTTFGGTGCDSTNAGAAGYFGYFGSRAGPAGKGYYSYDVGAWHLIALNSQCTPAGGCGPSSPQGKWLANDLATHANRCTLAYWHIPLFSSGGRASATYKSFWDQLYAAGADVVLNGHDHIYERFAPQTPAGAADAVRSIREFVVGTGGANHTSLAAIAANSEVRNASTYGVLQLTLHSTSYSWQFRPEAGAAFTDSGSASCH